jgi:peptidoglycan/xylan/chitin deacetylase (PgdA/CDA1 family)
MRLVAYFGLLATLLAAVPASASECPGNSGALGTSRTIIVDPSKHNLLGGHQYRETLPLNDKEVVITFDDGPLPPYSTRILDILAQECVKATFFMVGRMARSFPKIVRRVYDEGHTLANHSQNHPFNFRTMPLANAAREIEDGFVSIAAAVGDPAKVAPFFRFPGLHRQQPVEQYLASKRVMSWSVDFMADDWTRISSREVVRRALERLGSKGKGILLLHDIQPATALALPTLLSELKSRGYRVVHVVPSSADRTPTITTADQWLVRNPQHAEREINVWPRAFPHRIRRVTASLHTPAVTSFGAGAPDEVVPVALVSSAPEALRGADNPVALPAPWPEEEFLIAAFPAVDLLPTPAAVHFRFEPMSPHRAAKIRHRPSQQTTRVERDDVTGSVAKRSHHPGTKRSHHGLMPDADDRSRMRALIESTAQTGHQIQISNPSASLAPER